MLELDPVLHHPQPQHPSLDFHLPSGSHDSTPHATPDLYDGSESFSHYPSVSLDLGLIPAHVLEESQLEATNSSPQDTLDCTQQQQQQQQLHDLFALTQPQRPPQQSGQEYQSSHFDQEAIKLEGEEVHSQQEQQQQQHKTRLQRHRQQILERQRRHRPSTRRLYSTHFHTPAPYSLDCKPSHHLQQDSHSQPQSHAGAVAPRPGLPGGSSSIDGYRSLEGISVDFDTGDAETRESGSQHDIIKVWRSEAAYEAEFERVWRCAWEDDACDGFRSYRAKRKEKPQCNDLLAAREGVAGPDEDERSGKRKRRKGSVQKEKADWTDEREYAFFRAIVRNGPIGRKKVFVNSVLKGRNELVTLSIEEQAGVKFTRKIVSSHLQHLRPFFQHCPMVLQYFPQKSPKKAKKKSGRKKPKPVLRKYKPVGFEVTLHPGRDTKDELLPASHVYTHLQANTLEDAIDADSARELGYGDSYPQLLDAHEAGLLNCEVLLFDVSIELTAEVLLAPKQLATTLTFAAGHDMDEYDRLESRMQFFGNGHATVVSVQDFECCARDTKASLDSEVKVPFGSPQWAKIVSKLSTELAQATTRTVASNRVTSFTTAAKAQQSVRESLEGLTVVHEIFGQRLPSRRTSRLLCSFWKFRLAEPGEPGEATCQAFAPDTSKWKEETTPDIGASPQSEVRQSMMPQEIEGSVSGRGNGFDPLPLNFSTMQLEHSADLFDSGPLEFDFPTTSWAGSIPDLNFAGGQEIDKQNFHSIDDITAAVGHEATIDESYRHDDNEIDFSAGHIEISMGTNQLDLGLETEHLPISEGDVVSNTVPLVMDPYYSDLAMPLPTLDKMRLYRHDERFWDGFAEDVEPVTEQGMQ